VAETEGVYRAEDGIDFHRNDVGALAADYLAESATQGALGGGAGPDLGADALLSGQTISYH
tara:strand:+ start:854 stop:1036 length:183 start_codon:yes stop_codon:yes gene_type:complete